ncbi:MAG: Ribosomal RNA large subunit methyltransferase I [Elusimicrobia bacterium]|nr:Ribosomal RNA large subunit methyltransferase I [Elusimicrobiota bacterium]
MESIEITDRAAAWISRGFLWVYANEIRNRPRDLAPGTWVTFHCRSKVVATGYVNPHSLIMGRVLALGPHDNIPDLLKSRLENAFLERQQVRPQEAGRFVFSEADFIPGMILDVYADHAVLQSNTAGIDTLLPDLEVLIPAVFENVMKRKLKGLVVKADSGIRQLEHVSDFVRCVFGDENKFRKVPFVEEETLFSANLIEGQKTGFFLDQRDNRSVMSKMVTSQKKKRVLDLFCYSGGWGLRALKAGAEFVTFVDESKAALQLVREGAELNNFDLSKMQCVASDVFKFLERKEGSYDVVVVDPPAFVKSKKNIPQALRAYEKLNRLAWQQLKMGGLLFTSSCSFHVSEQEFMNLLQESVGKEKGWARVVYRGSQAADHPVLLSMPETRYLKCVALQKIETFPN